MATSMLLSGARRRGCEHNWSTVAMTTRAYVSSLHIVENNEEKKGDSEEGESRKCWGNKEQLSVLFYTLAMQRHATPNLKIRSALGTSDHTTAGVVWQ